MKANFFELLEQFVLLPQGYIRNHAWVNNSEKITLLSSFTALEERKRARCAWANINYKLRYDPSVNTCVYTYYEVKDIQKRFNAIFPPAVP